MNDALAAELIELNNRFYGSCAEAFSQTRQAPWQGWEKLAGIALEHFEKAGAHGLDVFDLACGNLRFEAFAEEALGTLGPLVFYAADATAELPALASTLHESPHFRQFDVLKALLSAKQSSRSVGALAGWPQAGLSVCFGFMHHVPSVALRAQVLRLLLEQTAPGGLVAVSWWNFMANERMAAKAQAAMGRAEEEPPFGGFDPRKLDANDYLLGWQDSALLRYCHNFNGLEVDRVFAKLLTDNSCPDFEELRRFRADGKAGNMNIYTVLERR